MTDKVRLVTPEFLRELYTDIAHFRYDVGDVLRKYCPDVSKYDNMVLVVMAHFTAEHNMWWQAYEIMEKGIFDYMCRNCTRTLDIMPHVTVKIINLVTECEKDPYKIANYVDTTTVPCTHIIKNGYAKNMLDRTTAPLTDYLMVNINLPRTQHLNRPCSALEPYVKVVDSPPKEYYSPQKVIKKTYYRTPKKNK